MAGVSYNVNPEIVNGYISDLEKIISNLGLAEEELGTNFVNDGASIMPEAGDFVKKEYNIEGKVSAMETLVSSITEFKNWMSETLAEIQASDAERAEKYEMPETEQDGFAEAYMHTPIGKIRAYSMAQFDHWTKERFSANFRKMLTLEQYRDPKLAQLYHDYLATGPTEYMAAIFRKLTDSDESAMQLALEFYGPMFLLYSIYDGAEKKEAVALLLNAHIDRFIAKIESGYRKSGTTL